MSGPWERYKAQGSTGAGPWERYAKPEAEEPGVFDVIQSYTTDIPVRAVKGALGGVEMVTNVFGADNPVSQLLEGAQQGINEYLVSDTAKRKAEERGKKLEGKGFLGTLAEVPGILASDPALLFEALGTAAPAVGVAALTGGSSALVQGAATLGSGALMGAGSIKGAIYDATKNELVKAGVDKKAAEAAADEAQSYTGENLDMIALGTALGAIASRTGMEPAAARIVAGRILGKSVGQAAGREALETALLNTAEKGAIRTGVTEALTEGAQGAQAQYAANLARKRQGADVDLMEGVGSAGALEGTLGGILGTGFGIAAKRAAVSRRLAGEEAASAAVTGEGPRAPEGFDREAILSRLGTAAGEAPTGQRMATAVSRKVNNDLAFGTPEALAETEAYVTNLEDKLDAGELPENAIDALRRPVLDESGEPVLDADQNPVYTGIIPETRAILNEFRQRAEAAPAEETTPKTTPIPYESLRWDEASGKAVPFSGTSDVVNYSGRMVVLRDVNGVQVPFYLSTGSGGKADVAAGKWYPFFGIGEDGWINKTTGADINQYYGSSALRKAAEELDASIGDIRNDESVPKVKATGAHIDAINAGLNPAANGTANTLTQVRDNIASVVNAVEGRVAPEEASAAPAVEEAAPVLYHGGRSGMTLDDINIVREPGATKQGKKGRVYGGFYATTNPEEAQGYADMAGAGNTVYAVQLRPDAVVEQKEGDITRLTPQQIDAYRARGVDVVVGKDVRGRTEHAIINKDAVVGLQDTQAAPVEAAPESAPIDAKSYVDRYMAGEGRGDTETDLEMQQFAANNPSEIEAEFARRAAEEVPSAPTPDLGGVEPSIPAVGEAQPVGAATETAAAPLEGGLERRVPRVPTADVGAAPRKPALGVEPIEPVDVAAERPAPPARPVPQVDLTVPQFETANKLVRLFNDRFADAPKVTEFFKEATGIDTVPEKFNLTRAFEQFPTKRAAQQVALERDFFTPITNDLKKERVSLPDFGLYLLSRAAPDKNKAVAEVNAAFPEGGSGIDNAEAAANMADFEARGLIPKLERIAKKHDELVDFMGQERVRSGILSQEEWNTLRAAQPYYTPFKGFAVDDDMLASALEEDPTVEAQREKLMREKRGLGVKEFFQAKGRNSLPFHPLYNLFADAEALARRTAMNDVYRTFENMLAANPQAMRKFVKGVYTEKPVTTQGVFMGPKQMVLTSADNPAGKEISVDMAREVMRDRSKYHVYKSDGITKYIEFSDNEAGQAAQRLFTNMQPKEMSRALEIVTDVNNVLKSLLTYRNPIYLTVVAPLRDTLDAVATAMLNRNIKGSPAYKKKIARKVAAYSAQPAMWRTVTRYVMGKEPLKGREDLMGYMEQMAADGGAPMSAAFRTAQDHAQDAIKELDWFRRSQEGDPLAIAREGATKVGRFFDHWAEINDLVPRLATYRAAVEEGLSGPEAASLALDSSLNLTRRGEMSNLMDNLFPFFSASVEGSRKVARIVKNPKTMMQVVGGMMLIGMAESLANAANSGDEDDDGTPDYLDVNPGTRMSRLVLYYGKGGDDYVTMPIGQMLGYFKYLGSKMTDVWLGVQSGEEAGAAIQAASGDVIGGLVGLLSPARVQGGDLERTMVSLVPLWGRPIADLALNQNYFGSAIYQPEREDTGPAAELGRATTGEAWKSIARGINELTGGSPARGGYINFQPEVYRYLLQTYLGGAGRLFTQVKEFTEEPKGDTIPVVQGFMGKGFDYVPQNKYKKNTEDLSKIIARADTLSDAQLAREQERNPTALDPRVIEAYQDTERALQRLYKQRREDQKVMREMGASESDKKALLEYYRIEMNKRWSTFNYIYDAVENGR